MHVVAARLIICVLLGTGLARCSSASAPSSTAPIVLTLGVATSLKPVMELWTKQYGGLDPQTGFKIVYGSSGHIVTQIRRGMYMDLFFSADMDFPVQLEDAKLTEGSVTPFAIGRSVLFVRVPDSSSNAREFLSKGTPTVVIADPSLAPWGRVARDYLQKQNLMASVRLITAPSASAAFLLASHAADAAIVPRSLQKNAKGAFAREAHWMKLDEAASMEHGVVLLKGSRQREKARRFADWIQSDQGRKALAEFGYEESRKK